ncbi:MAG: LysM peptidoglycan-binding domain-containing protein [Actinomycetota bacterium]|nr:LysM peptidoglycan-binding domain-containing protein [Actinomycetota bacterium]
MAGTKLEKAYLILVEPPSPPTKAPKLSEVVAKAKSGGEGEIQFMFNPKEYTIQKSANWERKPKKGSKTAAMPEFTGAGAASLQLEIFVDHSDRAQPTVAQDADRLLSCVVPLPKTMASKKPSPPWVVFGWGSRMSFVALVKSVSVKYTHFRPDGTPVRMLGSLSLEEVPTDPTPKQNPTSGGLSTQRSHHVVTGDTLQSIAYDEYGEADLWRGLAAANAIDDPLRLAAGSRLLIPTAAKAAELA